MSQDRPDSQKTEHVHLSLRSMDKLRRQYLQTLVDSQPKETTPKKSKIDLCNAKTPLPGKTTEAIVQDGRQNPFISAKHYPGLQGIETTKLQNECAGSSGDQPTHKKTFCKSTDCSDQNVRSLLAAKQQQTCIQSISLVLDVAQHVIEQAVDCFEKNCSQLELPLYFDKALQILSYEVLIASEEGDKVYPLLLDLLKNKIYRVTLERTPKNKWSETPLSAEVRVGLGQHPYKILYFIFRFLALVLYCVKHQILRVTKEKLAVELLKKLDAIVLTPTEGGRCCPLAKIFQHCRKNRLQRKEECHCRQQQSLPLQDFPGNTAPLNKQLLSQSLPNLTGYNGLFSGDLGLISIWQILQILGSEEKTGCLTVVGQHKTKIFLDAGRVVHCYSSTEKSEQAFFNTLAEDHGKFIFEIKKAPQKSMDEAVEYLLFECARLIDEQQRNQAQQ